MKGWGDYVATLRRGAAAARFLADELDQALDTLIAEKVDKALADRGWEEPEPA